MRAQAGFIVSMPMFGEGVFTICDKDSVKRVLGLFRKFEHQGRIIVSGVDFTGARVMYEGSQGSSWSSEGRIPAD